MTPHYEAWEHVKKHLFGRVLEISRKTPWGFYGRDNNIMNVDVKTYLNNKYDVDTIILHILSGEGEQPTNIIRILDKANNEAIKIVILEHNPESNDFDNLPNMQWMTHYLSKIPDYVKDDWGRNLLIAHTTCFPLSLPNLSDEYLKQHINNVYDNIFFNDGGICDNTLIFTHTSEIHTQLNIPDGTIYWAIGGGIPFEYMETKNKNILFDRTLRQVLYAAKLSNVDIKILKRLWTNITNINLRNSTYESNGTLWRHINHNTILPDLIIHKDITQLDVCGNTIYVSTIDKKYWQHLVNNNIIIDAWTNRNHLQIV